VTTGAAARPPMLPWLEQRGLAPRDLRRMLLLLEAHIDALEAGRECGCAWRALDACYRRAGDRFPVQRGEDGLPTQEFVVAELAALNATVQSLIALAQERVDRWETG
jgi:hypothetical protein